jgi:hypothetical protein
MKHLKRIVYMCGVIPLLGLALLTQPQPAHARVDVNVGLGVPAPVGVAPAPVVVVRRGHYRSHRGYYHRCNGLQSKRAGPAISAVAGPHYVPLSRPTGPH